eukprot:6182600-Pleurochrysis_carterae.AAC.4
MSASAMHEALCSLGSIGCSSQSFAAAIAALPSADLDLEEEGFVEQVPPTIDVGDTDNIPEGPTLKNWSKWIRVPPVCTHPLGRLVTMKMPFHGVGRDSVGYYHSPASNHTVQSLLSKYPKVTLIIDLQSSEDAYETAGTGVERIRLLSKSKLAPSRETVAAFLSIIRRHHAIDDDSLCALHCHYGFNRTGFLACCYLIEVYGFTPEAAILAFQAVRSPGIKHVQFKEELLRRYGAVIAAAPHLCKAQQEA